MDIGTWTFRAGKYAGLTYDSVLAKDRKYLERLGELDSYKYKEALKKWLGGDKNKPKPNPTHEKYKSLSREQLIDMIEEFNKDFVSDDE